MKPAQRRAAVRFFQADGRLTWLRGRVLEGAAGDVADPEGPHELQAGQPAELLGVPFAEGRVVGALTDDRVLHDRITEVVDDRRDGEYATESVVQGLLAHVRPPVIG